MGKLGEAVVEVYPDLKPLDSGLGQAERRIGGFVSGVRGLEAGLGISAGALGLAGVAAALLDSAKKAADLGESLSKTRTTFGKDAGSIESFADDMAEKFGLVKKETIDAATSIGLVGRASGLTTTESAALGVEMARLAADISSFHNVGMDEALTTIRSGLVGEAEPLRRFGVLLSEDAVKAEALRLGLARTTGELSEQAKVRARISLIKNAAAMKPVQGDLERTADSAANQKRKLEGDVENAKTKLGEAFIGPLTEAIKLATELGQALGGVGKDGASSAAEWSQSWLAAIRAVNQDWRPLATALAGDAGRNLAGAALGGIQGVMGHTGVTAALQDQADKLAGVKHGGKDKANREPLDSEGLAKQIRDNRAAKEKQDREKAEAFANSPAGKLQAQREAKLTPDERDARGRLDTGLKDEAFYKASLPKGRDEHPGYSLGQYRAAREKSGMSPEDYDAARKKTGLTPEVFELQRAKAEKKADRNDETRAGFRGLGQLAKGFAEKTLSAARALPDAASKDRATSLSGLARLQNAAGLLGPLSGAGGKLLSAGATAAGALGRGAEEGREQKARLGNAQVLSGADAAANLNLSEAFNAERDKQLAAQEKANDKLGEIKDGIDELVKKTGGAAGLIFGKKS